MDNKQKRKLISSIYKTINLFTFIALTLSLYLIIDKIYNKVNSILWLDITIIVISLILLTCVIIDIISTRKLKNKYKLTRFFYFLFFITIIALIVLSVYVYYTKLNITQYLSYILPISLVFVTELIIVINLILGIILSKLYKNSIITLDSIADTPTFEDEILLKKRLDELNRKLSMKKIQDQIDNIEKELDK